MNQVTIIHRERMREGVPGGLIHFIGYPLHSAQHVTFDNERMDRQMDLFHLQRASIMQCSRGSGRLAGGGVETFRAPRRLMLY